MNEHPILFSGPMVRAILEGRKTQTRRATNNIPGYWSFPPARVSLGYANRYGEDLAKDSVRCPYGVPGDMLYVRETTRLVFNGPAVYDVDGAPVMRDGKQVDFWYSKPVCPTIHMPKWAARLWLEVVSVRVERVQDISEEDAIAEGIEWTEAGPLHAHWLCDRPPMHCNFPTATEAFHDLWDFINAKRGFGWDENPWCWAVTFKRVEP